MIRVLSFLFCAIASSNLMAVEVSQTDYGFPLGNGKYLQKFDEGYIVSGNGINKKLKIESGMMEQLFKLPSEYVLVSVASPYYPSLIIDSISKDFNSKSIKFNHSNIPEYLIDGDFACDVKENSNALYINCSNLSKTKTVYKYIYKNGVISKLNNPVNTQAKSNHCMGEYNYYKELRASKPRGGYKSLAVMPNSIMRDLNSRLNINGTKYTQILDSQTALTFQQFKTKYCP